LAQSVTTLGTNFNTSLTNAVSTINQTLTSLSDNTSSLAQSVNTLGTNYTNLASSVTSKASITDVNTAISNSTASIASSLNQLKTDFATPGGLSGAGYNGLTNLVSSSTGSFATRMSTLEASVQTLSTGSGASVTYVDNAVATSTASIASALTSLKADFSTPGGLSGAAYNGLTSLVTNSTGSFASQVNSLQSSYNGLSSTVSTYSSSINGLNSKYGVKIDNNGSITGYELNSGASGSSFVVKADEFKVYTGGGNVVPFSVVDNTVYMQNVEISSTLKVGSGPAISPTDSTKMVGAGAKINNDGKFVLGNETTNITYNGIQMTLNGNVVATGNINANAVTLLVTTFTASDIRSTAVNTWQDFQVLTITSNGSPIYITTAGQSLYGSFFDGADFVSIIPKIRIVRNSTVLITGSGLASSSLVYNDQPGSGTHTYRLQVNSDTYPYNPIPSDIGPYAGLANSSLFLLEVKR
jgi:archaellum component FlaC